jgi:hypothetical protein
MTETERIAHAVYDRHQRPPLHYCHTSGCLNLVAGDNYCSRCAEEMSGQPYTFAGVLSEFPKWAHRLFWTSVFALAVFALSILLILL